MCNENIHNYRVIIPFMGFCLDGMCRQRRNVCGAFFIIYIGFWVWSLWHKVHLGRAYLGCVYVDFVQLVARKYTCTYVLFAVRVWCWLAWLKIRFIGHIFWWKWELFKTFTGGCGQFSLFSYDSIRFIYL